jgi:hypothetical protein
VVVIHEVGGNLRVAKRLGEMANLVLEKSHRPGL